MVEDFPHGNRVVRGRCHWHHTPDVAEGLERLRKQDSFAYGDIAGQIEDSQGEGLGKSEYGEPDHYRCPLERAPRDVPDPPWLGELKATSLKKRSGWRLYFGEAINYQDHVIGVTLRETKLPRLSLLQNTERQKQHIVQAMRFLKTFFAQHGYKWAPFPRNGG